MSEQPRRPRNTKLQDRILLYMEEHEVDTVSGLTRKLKGSRPSVSRAINVLADGGFVSKNGKGWVLTEAGKEEASSIQERHLERSERIGVRSAEEAFSAFVNSAKSLEQISKQARLFNRLLDSTSWVPKEEVPRYRLMRQLMVSLSELEEAMEPIEELGDLARFLVHQLGFPEEGAKALELDTRERLLLIDLASSINSATQAIERVSDEMQVLASNIDKTEPPREPNELGDIDSSKEELDFGDEKSPRLIFD